MCYCGLFLSSLSGCQLRKNQAAHQQVLSVYQAGLKANLLVLFLAVTNIPMALYTSTVHQRGSIDVMGYIHDESFKPASEDGMSVLFLMPCHSTPFFRYYDYLYILKCLQISAVFMMVVKWNTNTATCHCYAGHCSFSSGKRAEQRETVAFGSYEDSFGLASYSSVLQHPSFLMVYFW